MYKKFIFCLICGVFFSVSWVSGVNNHPKVKQIWEATGLKTPESVLFHNGLIYVANINGNPTDKDGNGFISIITPEGKVLQLEWATGLNAPKGMSIYKGRLYVSDINEVVEINLKNGAIIKKYNAPDSKFLNDITIDSSNGYVYISDMNDNAIYVLKNNELALWLKTDELDHPNGLWFENGKLMAGLSNTVVEISSDTKQVVTKVKETGGIDGLVGYAKNQWIISDWEGRVHIISTSSKPIKILDTTVEKINAADIEYIPEKKLLLVPTFFDNRVVAYSLE